MSIIPAKTPEFVKSVFPNFVWNISTEKKELYLTFDDGPTPDITEWVLNALDAYNAKATFFCIGNNIEKYPQIFKRIVAQGHKVGNHTYNHLKGWKCKTQVYVEDIVKAETVMQQAYSNESTETHSKFKLFRPPYGKFKANQAKATQKLGYKIILWDILSFDWDQNVSEDQCSRNVIASAKKGSIVVFHDSLKASRNLKFALPKVLEHFSKENYVFKALEL
ncbi:polysaccharide deacetylase family protein [Winogradskyella aurantia]|uniref:Polysaccharide deacetylase family protein n=1 Tax=Winogradskyella aurantia TaxID=1915063 RepID=A0A265V1D3_9FLAO|nr:polysaccharide deacetylase family protein [Winogradskyella aurantia]OZV71107.1 polysaccharide deacetylase family protein [Winogradskyella aurantia]